MILVIYWCRKLPETRTGPVRLSGYALKLRRVVNAALRDYYKEKKISSKDVNQILGDMNAKIYSILVDKYGVPKDAIINIILNYDIEENKFVIKDIKIEIYDLNEILTRNTTLEVKKLLNLPI